MAPEDPSSTPPTDCHLLRLLLNDTCTSFTGRKNRFDEKICCCILFKCNNKAVRTSCWQACEIPLAQLKVT